MNSQVRMMLIAAPMLALTFSCFLHSTGVGKPNPQATGYLHDLAMTSKFISSDFTPDGDLAKSVWRDAPPVKFDNEVRAEKHLPDSETQVASLWTANYLYLGYRCRYRELNVYAGEDVAKERLHLWDKDTAEAFINPEPERFSHYYEFEVAPNNQWVDLEIDLTKTPFGDAAWDSHFDHATKVDAQHHVWTAEMKIPVRSMGVGTLQAGAIWRLNLYRLDGPGDDTKRRFFSWSPLPPGKNHSFHQPASFGMIKFVP